MIKNLKIFGFFVLIALRGLVPYLNKKIGKGKESFLAESENARDLYTGKTKDVYNPLDTAYVVTDTLKELIKKEKPKKASSFKHWPVVSIQVDPKDRYSDNRGIFNNPEKKGRLWERAAYLTYYDQGKKKFSSFAGLRVHGGASRLRPDKSLRFYFRKDYGEPSFLTDLNLGLKENIPVHRLLLRRDANYRFANDMSYTLIRNLGGMAPQIKHVAVFINNEPYFFMQMMEQPHEDQARYYFGHKRFVFYKLKGSNPTPDRLLVENAIHIVKGQSKPISFKKMDQMFDLESFTANMLSIIYLSMADWAQGVWIKDLTRPDDKWKIFSWDFDFAFTDLSHKGKNRPNPWEINGFKNAKTFHVASLQSILFNRLISESPEYQEFFMNKVDELFEKALSKEVLDKKFVEYEAMAKEVPNNSSHLKSIKAMKDFISKRKPYFCAHMKETLKLSPKTCLSVE
jgi:hypothetical protein